MLKRKYMLVGLSTITILNLLSFHTRTTQAEELLAAYSSTEDSTMSSTSSEEKPTVDSSTTTDSSTKESKTESSTQDSTTDTSTVQGTTDEAKTSEQTTKESKDATQNSRAANFNLSDWQYTETADTITLNKYIGTSSDITIPAEINNKQVIIPSISNIGLPSNLTHLTFEVVNNKRVTIEDTNMNIVFQSNKSIEYIDLSGLNMDNVTSMINTFYDCSNLSYISFGANTLPKVTSMEAAFYQCINLHTIEGQWTLDSLQTIDSAFFSCNSLVNIDTSKWKLSQVSSLFQLFWSCGKLRNIDTSSWDVSNVTNLSLLFFQCGSLDPIDVSKWNVSKVTDAEMMFYGCAGVNTLDMSNWHFNSNVNLNQWFYLGTWGHKLFILATDPQILNYDYESDWRFPNGPYLDPNGGTLGTNIPYNNEYGKYCYLGSPAIRPDDPRIQDSTFKQKFAEVINSIPTRKDYAFTQWNVSGTPLENATTFRDLFNTTYTAQWVSSKYSTSVDNTILTTSANLDFAYIPIRFTTAATPIKNSGNQEIPLLKTETFNIGVKDRTRTNQSWTVTAQLTWDNPQLKDTYIQTYNPGGATNQNISTGSAPYDPSKDLVVNQDGVNGMSDVKISTSAPIPIMESNSQTNKNAVYDYGLGEAKLVIPETQNIQVGSYTGNVEWNLISAP